MRVPCLCTRPLAFFYVEFLRSVLHRRDTQDKGQKVGRKRKATRTAGQYLMMLSLTRCTELCGGGSEVVQAAGKLHHVRICAGALGLLLVILAARWGRGGVMGFCHFPHVAGGQASMYRCLNFVSVFCLRAGKYGVYLCVVHAESIYCPKGSQHQCRLCSG